MVNKLKRFDFLIDRTQIEQLQSLPGNVSEHIRRAIYEYLQKIYMQNVSASQSKVGDENG